MGRGDGSMSVREWARSRRIAPSTAAKAVKSGRISRRADGRVSPEVADREFLANTRRRVDSPVLHGVRGRRNGNVSDFHAERTRLMRADAALREIELARRQGGLL